MGRFAQQLLLWLNRGYRTPQWFEAVNRSEAEALELSIKSGEVVHGQFYGYNDFAGKVVLDYGCGIGGKTIYYATRGAKLAIGVDFPRDHGIALEYAGTKRLPLQFCDLESEAHAVNLEDGSVDVVISSSVFEHLADVPGTLREIGRILKPGGLLLNRWNPYRTRYGSHLNAALGVPFAHLFFSERDILSVCSVEFPRRFPNSARTAAGEARTINEFLNATYRLKLNFASVSQMRKAISEAGFDILQYRFLRGTKELSYPRFLPVGLVDYFIDYEIHICRKIR
jgi:SAM-dependent methyltransferase